MTEKIPEPFESFEFLGKPFDQTQLIDAIKSAMIKAKQSRQEPAQLLGDSSGVGGASAAQIQILNEKVIKMQAEIDTLKKQLGQLIMFLKQKMISVDK